MFDIFNKLIETKRHAEFSKAYFKMVNGFPNTDLLFKLMDLMRQQATPEAKEKMVAELMKTPGLKEYLEERYLPANYTVADLAGAEPGSLRYAYYRHMHDHGFNTNFFPPIKPTDDFSYFSLRMRQTHDIWHVITGFEPSSEGELGLQAYYAAQLNGRNNLVVLSGGFLKTVMAQRNIGMTMEAVSQGWTLGKTAKPLAFVNWEKVWNRSLHEIRQEYNVTPFSAAYDFAPEGVAV